MKVLSLRPFWAHAVIYFGKDVENRSWATNYRGRIAIHASSNKESAYARSEMVAYVKKEMSKHLRVVPSGIIYTKPISGAIIGTVELVECRLNTGMEKSLPFADEGSDYHWILRDSKRCAPYPCLGKLRLWECPDEWVKEI